jgi:hypothetical protein
LHKEIDQGSDRLPETSSIRLQRNFLVDNSEGPDIGAFIRRWVEAECSLESVQIFRITKKGMQLGGKGRKKGFCKSQMRILS